MKDPHWESNIKRKIGNETFVGKVEDIEIGKTSGERLYRVRYTDGDLEHYTAAQVEQFKVVDGHASGTASL